jgi:hypothetical protein
MKELMKDIRVLRRLLTALLEYKREYRGIIEISSEASINLLLCAALVH